MWGRPLLPAFLSMAILEGVLHSHASRGITHCGYDDFVQVVEGIAHEVLGGMALQPHSALEVPYGPLPLSRGQAALRIEEGSFCHEGPPRSAKAGPRRTDILQRRLLTSVLVTLPLDPFFYSLPMAI